MEHKKVILGVIITGLGLLALYFAVNLALQRKEAVSSLEKKEGVAQTSPQERPEEISGTLRTGPILPEESGQLEQEIRALIDKLNSNYVAIVRQAAEELARLGKKATPILLKFLPDAPLGIKGQIILVLGKIGDKQATPVLISGLQDANSYIRKNAAAALGEMKDDRAIPALNASLYDEEPDVRGRSAFALGELNNPAVTDTLLSRLSDEKEESVKSTIANVLGKLKDERAIILLLRELKSEASQSYKNDVVASLGSLSSIQAAAGLREYLNTLRQSLNNARQNQNEVTPVFILQLESAIQKTEEAVKKIEKG